MITSVPGFKANGLASGIKGSGAPDLAMVATVDGAPVAAAGVFTSNLVAAAPVQISRRHLADGRAAAVVLNSGNANAATGEQGRRDALRMCELTGRALGCATSDVLVAQTGLIGIPMPMGPIESGVPELAAMLSTDALGGLAAAQAMMTTDTVAKHTHQSVELPPRRTGAIASAAMANATMANATIGGMAKGAAMLAPAMATMLAVLATDVAIAPPVLTRALQTAVSDSFNALVVDACQSTNDTVVVLANGVSGNEEITETKGVAYGVFVEALTAACADLAHQMARDAEGATKCVTLRVHGARNDHEARLAARRVASSQLVQCSLYGKDPYWGRIISELGVSGAVFDPEQVTIAYDGIVVCDHGIAAPHDVDAVARAMDQRDLAIVCDLHDGNGEATMLFTDLTHAYVDENMGTS
jgi:glutamate N-acetyltransferase/amino-acid N-acetyltransferase